MIDFKLLNFTVFLAGLMLIACYPQKAYSEMNVTNLKCEYLVNPLGIDSQNPRLFWILESPERGQKQTAYRIIVASSKENLTKNTGDLWDSGKVISGNSTQIAYGGKALTSGMQCFWKVCAWDKDGVQTAFSAGAYWTMGLINKSAWTAKWITMENPDKDYVSKIGKDRDILLSSPPYFRKEFTVTKPVKKAFVYATARGLYELRINGSRVGEDYFTPGWTQYGERIRYQTYDVTGLIKNGNNAAGAILAEGWFSGHLSNDSRWVFGKENSLLAQLKIEYNDGTSDVIGTDETWNCSTGPIMYASIYMGEKYDFNNEMTGWDTAGYKDTEWKKAAVVEAPAAVLSAECSNPVHITGTIKPVKITEPKKGVYVIDLGQNIVGWPRLKFVDSAKAEITIRHAERLNEDGSIYTVNLRSAKAEDVYLTKGAGKTLVLEPHFTFHGFQYIEITGFPGKLTADNVTGIVVHSDTPPSGTFACSNSLVNKLFSNIQWGQRDNFLSVPTDCPQRDERMGWMGDAQTFIMTATYNMDVSAFFTKWMYDVEDAQSPDGAYSYIVPTLSAKRQNNEAGPAWSDAGIIIPWTIYQEYGDTRMAGTHWASMEKFMDCLLAANPDFIRKNKLSGNWGDWLSIDDDTPKFMIATAFWAYDALLMSDMAKSLGKTADAEKYDALYKKIREVYQKNYVSPDGRVFPQNGDLEKTGAYAPTHHYVGGIGESQTGYLISLYYGLVPDNLRAKAAENLARKIKEQNGHLSSGFVGVRYLNPVLSETGHNDIAYKMLLNETYPSWLYPVKNGATTIWERWDGWTKEKGFQDPAMNSFNHYSLGSVGEWLYRYTAGIKTAPDAPGFKKIIIKPYPGKELDYAKAEYKSIQGLIASSWNLKNNKFILDITIPANTTASVYIPADENSSITESGALVKNVKDIRIIGREDGYSHFEVPSGKYHFESTLSR